LFVDRDALERARLEFERRHCVLLNELLAPDLARTLVSALERATFEEYAHDQIGTELVAKPNLATGVLELLANDPELFAAIRTLTGCGPIGCFHGRVYRMVPSSGHYDSWHSDEGFDRLITMSINLSAEPYTGGLLQLREKASSQLLHEVANIRLGDAIVFRIAPTLTHRVTEVAGTAPKTAYAGWFRTRPSYRALVEKRVARARASRSATRRSDRPAREDPPAPA
jgi:hypothetical protein